MLRQLVSTGSSSSRCCTAACGTRRCSRSSSRRSTSSTAARHSALYLVLSYLALLRLQELGFPSFKALLLSQEHFKMSVLLKFLFSEENLAKWLRPEWLKLYDPAFVDEELIGKVLVFVPQVQSLQVVLEGNMAKEAAKKEAARGEAGGADGRRVRHRPDGAAGRRGGGVPAHGGHRGQPGGGLPAGEGALRRRAAAAARRGAHRRGRRRGRSSRPPPSRATRRPCMCSAARCARWTPPPRCSGGSAAAPRAARPRAPPRRRPYWSAPWRPRPRARRSGRRARRRRRGRWCARASYKLEVMAPKPAGPGLSEDEVVTVFNRILERLILLSEKKYRFESRHEGIVAPYDYFEFGQEYVERRVESNLSSLAAQAASWQPTHTPRTDPPGCGLLHALERREPARHRSPRDLHEGGGATPAHAET